MYAFFHISSIIQILGYESGHYGISGILRCYMWKSKTQLWIGLMVSTYNLVCFNIERWFAITFSMKHMTSVKKKHIIIICVCVWLGSFIYNMGRFIPTTKIKEGGVCYWWSHWPHEDLYEFAQILHIILWFILPFFCLIFTNTSVLIYIMRRNKKWQSKKGQSAVAGKSMKVQENDQKGKATKFEKVQINMLKTLVTVSMAFCFCFIWNTVWLFLNKARAEFADNQIYYDFSVILVFLNVCINPALYSIQYRDFQIEAKKLFCRLCHPKSEDEHSKTSQSVVSISGQISHSIDL